MQDIIQLLPDAIANQIAAGEVVQRPASVVKELLENAIDAKASQIDLIVKDAGKLLVQVVDNGIGMTETDARMSFERHATSKIRAAEDLFALRTMGFRGEALASIAAVAQVEMKTRRIADDLGTCLVIEASQIKKQEPIAVQEGTSIAVKNLFFNIPARRNFLKSNHVELKHITEEFQRVALANPEVGFKLFHNDQELFHLSPGKLSQRIVGLLGKSHQGQMAACQEETPLVSVRGYVGKPEAARKTRGDQFFFVNNRFIKSPYLHHAVVDAYQGLIAEDQFPFYVLMLEIDPSHIDVNVHPTKTEIKFDDERSIYAVVRAAVRQALGTHNLTPSLDFELDINVPMKLDRLDTSGMFEKGVDISGFKGFSGGRPSSNPLESKNRSHWEKLFEEMDSAKHFNFGSGKQEETSASQPMTMPSKVNREDFQNLDIEKPLETDTFQVHGRYIVSQVRSGMLFLDICAAHERILYEKYLTAVEKGIGASQQFLFPSQLQLQPGDFALVMEIEKEIKALGFHFEVFGQNTLVIQGVPVDAIGSSEKELFEGLIEQYKHNKAELSLDKRENLARSMAKRAAIKSGAMLDKLERKSLIDQLFACKQPAYSPTGQLTYYILDLQKIAGFFNR